MALVLLAIIVVDPAATVKLAAMVGRPVFVVAVLTMLCATGAHAHELDGSSSRATVAAAAIATAATATATATATESASTAAPVSSHEWPEREYLIASVQVPGTQRGR